MQVWHFRSQKLGLGGDAPGADPTYLLYLSFRSRGELRRIDFGAWPHTATLRLKLSPESSREARSVGLAVTCQGEHECRDGEQGRLLRFYMAVLQQSGTACVCKLPNTGCQCISPNTHNLPSPSAPFRGSPPPKDNEQATKAAEHGEQRGDGVDAVDPGDLARGGGAANRLNTGRNSQSKCGARRNARLSSRGAQGTAQSTGAAGLGVLRTASAARHGRGTYRTVSPHRLRGCWPRGAAPTHPRNLHRPQPPAGSPVKGSTSL